MSYCRFSSDNFKSDFYIYESCCGGYQIHLAANRVVGDIPKIPHFQDVDSDTFFEAYSKQVDFLETAEREKINLPFAGDGFGFDTPEEAILKIKELVLLGYNLPKGVIESLEEDSLLEKEEIKIEDCL